MEDSTPKLMARLKKSPEAEVSAAKEVDAPFSVGTKVRYIGRKRLSADYSLEPILAWGMDFVIIETIGGYSLFETPTASARYVLCIQNSEKSEWEVRE